MSSPISIRPARKQPLPHECRFVGLDEAGRGPVLGPMVIAVCALTKRDIAWCIKHNVTDSKKVASSKREKLAKALKKRCWHSVAIIYPPEIDSAVNDRSMTLNGLEIKYMSQLIAEFKNAHLNSPAQIMVDAPVRHFKNFRLTLNHLSGWDDFDSLQAQNKADLNHRHVGAASIIAKTTRDAIMRELQQSTDLPLGSGYPSDPISRQYVKQAHHRDPLIRWSWMTTEIRKSRSQDV